MQNNKYHISARIMHWLMALIIISLLVVGFYMANWMDRDSPYRMTVYGLHKSFGVLVLFLIVARIFIRFSKPVPPLPESIPLTTRKISHLVHILLYVLMILMPISGYLMSTYFGYQINFFGVNLPMLVREDMEMGDFFAKTHEVLGFAFAIVLTLHIAGVIKHRFFDFPENDVLKRMI
jgi:cytochrome b561